MTVTHIIERLERLKSFEKCPYPIFITKEDSEVLDLAIKSLEAWEIIRNNIKEERVKTNYREEIDTYNKVLSIIDKHLKEVSE